MTKDQKQQWKIEKNKVIFKRKFNKMEEKIKNNNFWVKIPIIVGLALASGILIGAKMFGGTNSSENEIMKNARKFADILSIVNNEYVDTVSTEKLTEGAIVSMLENLDPHSQYIPIKDMAMAKTQLEGNFEGVGIEFHILKDTIMVVAPISGGPSESVGIKSGDKIIEVDDKKACKAGLTNNDVFGMLRGKKGTKVKIAISRRGMSKLLTFTVTRDKIPTFSVDASYMVDEITGYIKVSRFSANTYIEFKEALGKLKEKSVKRLILDLRDNPGGYMDRATKMVDEFLGGNKLIVYTDSKEERYDSKYFADVPGDFEKGALIILVNEGSASASEIVSGAIQDNDRGLVVGRRTFGKGLVQMPVPLNDGSELRITISRYYTPSGRSIQKPYAKNKEDDYNMDLVHRYEKGEFFSADSIKFDQKLKYYTAMGRLVFGGGGIMPDVFIPRDTSSYTPYLAELYNKSVIREFSLNYSSENKKKLEAMGLKTFASQFKMDAAIEKDFLNLAKASGVKFNEKEYLKSKTIISNGVKSFIARGIWQNEGFYTVYNQTDEMFEKSMKLFGEAEKIERADASLVKPKTK